LLHDHLKQPAVPVDLDVGGGVEAGERVELAAAVDLDRDA
jgi:hypothetical protein